MTGKPRNVAASVRDRLLRIAQQRGEDFQALLTRYANERLLARLAASPHAEAFVLKGATLFTVWTGEPHRATRDVDLLGFGEVSPDTMRRVFHDIITANATDDGVELDAGSLTAQPIRADQKYGGVRLVLVARIAGARVRLQIDVGCGDAITPAPCLVELPALLEFSPPRLRAYQRETVVAEKLHAVVELGMANSRMKDFYDLVVLANRFTFDGAVVVRAISATFGRRGTVVPMGPPVAFTPSFVDDPGKRTQWAAFVRKADVERAGTLAEAVATIAPFALPLFHAAAADEEWAATWVPGGPWE